MVEGRTYEICSGRAGLFIAQIGHKYKKIGEITNFSFEIVKDINLVPILELEPTVDNWGQSQALAAMVVG